jgi:hypothetical protein
MKVTLNLSDKILISCVSTVFVIMIWIAKPPKDGGKKAMLGVKDGRALSYFRPVVSVVILIINIGVWVIR